MTADEKKDAFERAYRYAFGRALDPEAAREFAAFLVEPDTDLDELRAVMQAFAQNDKDHPPALFLIRRAYEIRKHAARESVRREKLHKCAHCHGAGKLPTTDGHAVPCVCPAAVDQYERIFGVSLPAAALSGDPGKLAEIDAYVAHWHKQLGVTS